MKATFEFIIFSLEQLLPDEFYLFPLILSSFLLLLSIVFKLRGGKK